MVINTNSSAASSARMLSESSAMLAKSLARLSSGSKLVSPEDDAAGAAVSLRFEARINRTDAAKANVNNAISFNQTQDGYLNKVAKALDRMSELAVLAQDVTKSTADIALYDKEYKELAKYIDSDVKAKTYNSIALFGGATLNVTTDGDSGTYAMVGVNLGHADYTGATAAAVTLTGGAAATTATAVSTAITKLAEDRATIGANVSRLSKTAETLSVLADNLSAANSRIKDVDVAEESTRFARYNILVQSGTAMLAQANATPNSALRLLS